MAANYFWTHHQRKRTSSAQDVKLWLKQETTRGTWKAPASTDVIKVNSTLKIAQLAERVAEAGLASGDRDPAAEFLGRFDHFEVPIELHPRPPLALAGTSVPQEHLCWLGVMGSVKYSNSQLAENITAVVSHSRTATVIQVADTLADWSTRPNALRYISNNSDTLSNNGLYEVTAATEPTSGTLNLTISPGLPHYPITSGTADQIQGVTCYYSDDDSRWEDIGISALVKVGFQTFGVSGGCINDFSVTRDARSLLAATFNYHGERIAFRAAEDQLSGTASGDFFNATELVLKAGNAFKQTAGARLMLKKINNATGLVVATEGATTPLVVASVAEATNLITFLNRGDLAFSASDLFCETGLTQEKNGTYDTTVGRYLRISVSQREFITIDLQSPTAPAVLTAATKAEIAANINYAFKTSKYYGQFHEGRGGQTISWETVATVTAPGAVKISDPCFGSEARIQVEDTGAALSAHATIFNGAFDIQAGFEVQVVPWNPGGSVTLNQIHNKFGMPSIDGHQMKGSEFQCSLSQQVAWIEDVVNLDAYPDGLNAGPRREVTASWQTPGYGWTDALDAMAEADSTHYVRYEVGKALGGGYLFAMGAARVGVPDPGGDNTVTKTVTVSPATPSGGKAFLVAVG